MNHFCEYIITYKDQRNFKYNILIEFATSNLANYIWTNKYIILKLENPNYFLRNLDEKICIQLPKK